MYTFDEEDVANKIGRLLGIPLKLMMGLQNSIRLVIRVASNQTLLEELTQSTIFLLPQN